MLVTDGNERAALAIVRSLGRAGCEVYVCSQHARSIAAASRFCTSHFIVPDALADPDGFLQRLITLCRELEADYLMPVSEAALLAVLPSRNEFKARIPFPDAAVFQRVADKALVLQKAESMGIPVPRQVLVRSPVDARAFPPDIAFPVAIKPSRSVAVTHGTRVRGSVSYSNTLESAIDTLTQIPVNAYPVLVQQRIRGVGMAVSVLIHQNRLRAAFAHRRIREKPPSGGVSVLSESITLDPALLSQSVELLLALGWEGVAMVEYKADTETGTPCLMEINGRFWGSLQLAVDSGVDFPALLVRAARGEEFPAVTTYNVGTQLRWEWGNVDSLIATLRSPHLSHADGRSPGRLGAVGAFLGSAGSAARGELMRRDDPAPFFRESVNWFRAILS